jgi:hypothetical protein
LISPHEPKNIYNAAETGLFFQALPTKSLPIKGEKCTGGKISNKKVTVLLCEKWKSSKTKDISRT